jgi:hypothetical protein
MGRPVLLNILEHPVAIARKQRGAKYVLEGNLSARLMKEPDWMG